MAISGDCRSDSGDHRAGTGIEAHGAVGKADALDGAADDGRVVEARPGGDLAQQDDEPVFTAVSSATRLRGSWRMHSSSTASEI